MNPVAAVLKSFVDLFKLGRIIFYPLAGATVVIPADLWFRLMLHEPELLAGTGWRSVMLMDLRGLGGGEQWEIATILFGSVVMGFLVAVRGFSRHISRHVNKEMPYPDTYVHLLTRGDTYEQWLDSEYFRFVEIATFFPLAFLSASAVAIIYTATLAILAVPDPGLAVFSVIAVVVAILSGAWLHNVVPTIAESYEKARADLVKALDGLPVSSP